MYPLRIILPPITSSWLRRTKVWLETQDPNVWVILRDGVTEDYRKKLGWSEGTGVSTIRVKLYAEKPADPFSGYWCVSWGKAPQMKLEWYPASAGQCPVARFVQNDFWPADFTMVEEWHSLETTLVAVWDEARRVLQPSSYRREWNLLSLGKTSQYLCWGEFLSLIRTNSRYRRLLLTGAPKSILKLVAGLIDGKWERIKLACGGILLPEKLSPLPLSESRLVEVMAAVGYTLEMIDSLLQRKDEPANLWADCLELEDAWYECQLPNGYDLSEMQLTASPLGNGRFWGEFFLRSEFGLSHWSLAALLQHLGGENLEFQVKGLVASQVQQASFSLQRYLRNLRKIEGEFRDFLVWVERYNK